MRSGRLRHRVVVLTKTATQDDTGGISESWAETGFIWASIEPQTGAETVEGQQVRAHGQVDIIARAASAPTREQRLQYGSQVYEIEHVIDRDERHREARLICREIL